MLSLRIAPAIEHVAPLSRFSFRTVVDVGANKGQFAAVARRLFPEAQIYSFEPLSDPAAQFARAFAEDSKTKLFTCALGPNSGTAPIYVTTRDDSSSLLKPGTAQSEIFGVQAARTDEVAVRRLSECVTAEAVESPALLKVDVQGGELDVLEGASDLIDKFDALYIECSFVELYDGQPLFGDVARTTEKFGFRLRGIYNQYCHPQYGPVQADFLFLKAAAEGEVR
jgi:FkbM family methyltransferase